MMGLNSYLTLGKSGLRVSPFCLGTMTFGEDWGWGASVDESKNILSEYIENGGNFIDTANIYTNGHSEEIIGDYFTKKQALRDRVVIATKFFGNLYAGDPNGGSTGRKAIIKQCEESLRRLQTDYIDLYWMHNWDPSVPVEETLRTMEDLVTSGKVRYLGVSNLPAWKVAQMHSITHFRGWARIIAIQIEYSLLERTAEGELMPMANELGLGIMPWSPLRNGWLSGKYTRENKKILHSERTGPQETPSEKDYQVIDILRSIAEEKKVSPAAIALSWIQNRPGITSTVLGVRSIQQLRDNIQALNITLSASEIVSLEEATHPLLNYPYDNNKFFAPTLAFAGATVDNIKTSVLPSLVGSSKRY
ncbi:aldo/keto reductase [Serratia fonticola]